MNNKVRDTAQKLFKSEYEKLTAQEKHVAHHITERTPISENVIQDYSEKMTFGQKMADKDRLSAEHDYEVNLKSELEIIALHEKVDSLKQEQWRELISTQEEQLTLLGQLVEDMKKNE